MSISDPFGVVGANHDGGVLRSGKVPRMAGHDRGDLVAGWRPWRVVVVAVAAAVMFASVAPVRADDHSDTALLGAPDPVAMETGEVPRVSDFGEAATIVEATSDGVGVAAHAVAGAGGVPGVAVQSSGGWWDGTAVPAADAPTVVERGSCPAFGEGGSLAVLAGGKLSTVCAGDGLSGSVRGVGWFEGFDSDGIHVGVKLVGESGS